MVVLKLENYKILNYFHTEMSKVKQNNKQPSFLNGKGFSESKIIKVYLFKIIWKTVHIEE